MSFLKYFASSILLIPSVIYYIKIMTNYNILDKPEKEHSNHKTPIPRGVGILIISYSFLGYLFFKQNINLLYFKIIILTISLALIFLIEDLSRISFFHRFIIQIIFALILTFILKREINELMSVFLKYEYMRYFLVFFGSLWFMNLYNFMDGIDLMTTLNTIFIILSVIILSEFRYLKSEIPFEMFNEIEEIAKYILPCLLVFVFFNKPVAKVFLGDSGSVAFGFFIAFLLIKSSTFIGIVNSIIISMYYILDATLSILLRIRNKEKIWLSSGTANFFQKAKHSGFSVYKILFHILVLDIFLLILAVLNEYFTYKFGFLFLFVGFFAASFIIYRFQKNFIK